MPATSNKRGVVLVADDDPVMRLLMLEMLGQVGLDAIEAEDGLQAVACFQSMAPDLMRQLDVTNGFRTLINTGEDGRQEVQHVHMHVMGGPRPWAKG